MAKTSNPKKSIWFSEMVNALDFLSDSISNSNFSQECPQVAACATGKTSKRPIRLFIPQRYDLSFFSISLLRKVVSSYFFSKNDLKDEMANPELAMDLWNTLTDSMYNFHCTFDR